MTPCRHKQNQWRGQYPQAEGRSLGGEIYCRGYIDHHIKPYIGDIPLNKLTTLDLQRLYKKLLNGSRAKRIEPEKQPKGLSPKTVRNINQVISSALTFAKEQKLVLSNSTNGCFLPKLEHRK